MSVAEILEQLRSLGPWAPLAYVAFYAVGTVLFLPGSIMTLAAGALFGGLWGTIWVSIGSTLGACAAFQVSRHAARRWVEPRLATDARWVALRAATLREGWKIVLLARLSPVLPFNLLNYAFGLSGVSFKSYAAASWLGMLPGIVVYVNAAALAAQGVGGKPLGAWRWALYGAGLLATALLVIFLARTARRELERRLSARS